MRDDRHPRLRTRTRTRTRGRLLGIEPAKADDETLGISAQVGMVRSNELPAEPLGFPRPALAALVLVADVCHVAPVDDEGNFP